MLEFSLNNGQKKKSIRNFSLNEAMVSQKGWYFVKKTWIHILGIGSIEKVKDQRACLWNNNYSLDPLIALQILKEGPHNVLQTTVLSSSNCCCLHWIQIVAVPMIWSIICLIPLYMSQAWELINGTSNVNHD